MGVMNELINTSTVLRLASLLSDADPTRDWVAVKQAADHVDGLQLRARSDLVAEAILSDNASDAHDLNTSDNPSADVARVEHTNTKIDGAGTHGDASGVSTDGDAFGASTDIGSTGHRGGAGGRRIHPTSSQDSRYDGLALTIRRALHDPSFTGWMIWPVSEAVTSAALGAWSSTGRAGFEEFDDGLELLSQLTPRLTGEFAIRRFLAADLERALANILPWTRSTDEHVRRLASEGTRPFLPWAVRVASLTTSPQKTVPILDALRSDSSEYVRRSVANHLNDLSRQNPVLVVQTAERWLREPDANTRWVVRHGLRSLIKKADPGALALMGFSEAAVEVSPVVVLDETVVLPGALDFSFTVTNEADSPTRLAIDYVVSYVKSSGGLAEKVFKLTTRDLEAGETIELKKRHAIHQMTTRVHYAGTHLIELQINGRRYSRREFEVEIPP